MITSITNTQLNRTEISIQRELPPCFPIQYIENKSIDFNAVETLLAESRIKNHWANYGPVNCHLEEHVAQLLGLAESKKVVMCKSGTAALHTLVLLEELKAKQPLKWVISSFGFIASNVGCLQGATIIDCDEGGMLSIDALSELPIEDWDGVVITNIFGLCKSILPYQQLCARLNKKLIIDNAVGLFSSWRDTNSPPEAISFHQTKPWGTGEGGCMIVNQEDEEIVRDMICFGRGRDAQQRYAFSNEKLADINAAAILSWLKRINEWSPAYIAQSQRIADIAQKVGFKPLQPLINHIPYGNVPLLADKPIKLEHCENHSFTVMKYYHPLAKTSQAENIYSRIINIPSHQTMSQVSSIDMHHVLQGALDK